MSSHSSRESELEAEQKAKYDKIQEILHSVFADLVKNYPLKLQRVENDNASSSSSSLSSSSLSPNRNVPSVPDVKKALPGPMGQLPFHVPVRTQYHRPKNMLLHARTHYRIMPQIEDPIKDPQLFNPVPPYGGYRDPIDPGLLPSNKVAPTFSKLDGSCFPIRCVNDHLTIPLLFLEFFDLIHGKDVQLGDNTCLQSYSDGEYLIIPSYKKLPTKVTTGIINTAIGAFHRAAMSYFCIVQNIVRHGEWKILYTSDQVVFKGKAQEVQFPPYPLFDVRYSDHAFLTEMKYIHYCIEICKYYSSIAEALIEIQTDLDDPATRASLVVKRESSLDCNSEYSDAPEYPMPLTETREGLQPTTEPRTEERLFPSNNGNTITFEAKPILRKKTSPKTVGTQGCDESEQSQGSSSTSRNSNLTESQATTALKAMDPTTKIPEGKTLLVDENDYAAALFLSEWRTMVPVAPVALVPSEQQTRKRKPIDRRKVAGNSEQPRKRLRRS